MVVRVNPARTGGRRRRVWTGFTLAGLLLTPGAWAADPPPPTELLARMAGALAATEFEGTLVYLHGHQLSALRVVHRIEGGQSRESLLALSGPVRAMARSERGVTCVLPDARPIQVRRGADLGPAWRAQRVDPARLAPHYQIEALGQSRVAGRDTDVVGIIPRDALRYGYRYYVDRDTGLPLKTDLMDSTATPVEQVMFTDIAVIAQGTPLTEPVAAPAGPPPPLPPGWRFGPLPDGFAVVTPGEEGGAEPHPGRDSVLLSDGVASVSVTVEPVAGQGFEGVTCLGAAHAAGAVRDGRQLTAVGEVPAATVQAILDGLRVAR